MYSKYFFAPAALLLAFLLSALLTVSCAEMFQPKIPLPVNDNHGSLGDVFKEQEEETITQLNIPAQLYVAASYSRSQIQMTWEAVRNAAYYMIERAVVVPVLKESVLEWETPADEQYEIIERFVYGTLYIDEVLKNPSLDSPEFQNRYYYRISAFNPAQALDESEPCEPQYAMLFRSPSGARASDAISSDYIEVRWESVEGAVSYEIWRSSSERGLPVLLGVVSGNQNYFINMIDKNDQGVEFYYIITAINRLGNVSLQTRPVMGSTLKEGAPVRPVIRRTPGYGRGNSSSTTRIEWDAVDNAEYYAVSRFTRNAKTDETDYSLTRLTTETKNTFWVDSAGLKPGIYYYYRVWAIGKDSADKEVKSPASGPGSDKLVNKDMEKADLDSLAESYILSPPDTVIAEKNIDGTITIKWTPPIGSDEEVRSFIYTVYADSEINGSFVNAVSSGITSTIVDGYIRAERVSAQYGQFFRVVTFNGPAESASSVVVTPVPSEAVIEDVTQYAFISPDAAANTNGVYPVRITWKKPENDEPVFYHVQRSTREDGGFSRINEAPLKADGTGFVGYSFDEDSGLYSFIDRNDTAKAGRKYYYRVLSLNQLGDGNFYSKVLTGWGALTHTQYMLEYNKTMSAALKKLTYMHKPGSTEKLGTETKNGTLSGTIYYNGRLSGLGAYIEIKLTNYAEFYIENEPENGVYFTLNGNSNTTANMSSNGNMDGTVTCTGMYPGSVSYDRIEIKGGAAGGGTYGIQPAGFPRVELPYTVLN